jgi:hypothetical protein
MFWSKVIDVKTDLDVLPADGRIAVDAQLDALIASL